MLDKAGLTGVHAPHGRVITALGGVSLDRHALVLVALANDAAFSLLDGGREPRRVQVAQPCKALLGVYAGLHILAADQYALAALTQIIEQALFLRMGLVVPHEGDVFRLHSTLDQSLLNPCFHIEATVLR